MGKPLGSGLVVGLSVIELVLQALAGSVWVAGRQPLYILDPINSEGAELLA